MTQQEREARTRERLIRLAGKFGRMIEIGHYRQGNTFVVMLDNGDASSTNIGLFRSLDDAVDACWQDFKDNRNGEEP